MIGKHQKPIHIGSAPSHISTTTHDIRSHRERRRENRWDAFVGEIVPERRQQERRQPEHQQDMQ